MKRHLAKEEVVLLEEKVQFDKNEDVNLILTSENLIFEMEKGILKKVPTVIEKVKIADIKVYKDNPQVKLKKSIITMQTIKGDIEFICKKNGRKIVDNIISIRTGKNVVERTIKKAKKVTGVLKESTEVVNDVVEIGATVGKTVIKKFLEK